MKVLVIGLDGATFDLIKPWSAQGELPTFSMLMKDGVYSELISTIPPVSGPAWSSFTTGKNLGKHGVFDFVGRGDGYSLRIKNRRDIKAKTLWRLLSEEGKTCIVINVPMTYPPEKIEGCIVTGMMTPPGACFAYPPEIYEELKKIGYKIGARGVEQNFSPNEILNHLIQSASKKVEAVLYLMKRFDWDFCMLVFSGTDKIQHYLWQYHKGKILQYYKKIDALIKKVIENMGKDTNGGCVRAGVKLEGKTFNEMIETSWHRFYEVRNETLEAVKDGNWDLLMAYTRLLDVIGELRFRKFGVLFKAYSICNQFVGEAKKHFGDNTICLIISDHGMERLGDTPF